MPSASENLRDLQVQHALHILGYSNALQGDILKFLNAVEQDAVERLGSRLAGVKTGRQMSQAATDRVNELIDETRALIHGAYDKSHDHLKTELLGFAQSEAEWTNKATNSATYSKLASKLPAPNRLKVIVESRPLHGQMLKPWLDKMGEDSANRVSQQIRLGIAEGEGVDKIVRRVMGTDGFEGSRRSARTMVRTSVNAISAQTQMETMQANPEIYKGWQFSATLDSRTTVICGSLDGQVFPLGEGPMPPRHPNCRSVIQAVTKSFEELGLKGKDYSSKTRASMDGQIAQPTNFEKYLRDKGEDFQNNFFKSATRADLWRRGKLNLNDFVRNYNEVIPLSELRKLHPEAFGGEAAAVVPQPVVQPVAPAVRPKAPKAKNPAKAIDHAIRGETIDTAALDALERDYVLDRGRETMTEHLVAYDARTGEIFERKEGDRSTVIFSPALVAAVNNPKNRIILHHNHPSSASLSLADLMIVTKRRGAAAIYAHGHNGSVFYARKGTTLFKKATVDAVGSAVQRSLQILINRGIISVADANLMHNHLIWTHLHHLGQITYIAELQGESLAAWERNKAMYELILENMK